MILDASWTLCRSFAEFERERLCMFPDAPKDRKIIRKRADVVGVYPAEIYSVDGRGDWLCIVVEPCKCQIWIKRGGINL